MDDFAQIKRDLARFPPPDRAPKRIMIWDGSPIPDGMVALRLIEVGDNEIMLAAVDEGGACLLDPLSNGHAGALMTITDRHYVLALGLMPSLMFATDVHGRLAPEPSSEALVTSRAKNFGGKRASFRAIEGDAP